MSSATQTEATVEDLAKVDSKAELIGGRIVPLMPTGRIPNLVAGRIFRRLAAYADTIGRGEAYTDNMGFVVPQLSSGRQSFSPDASYFLGPFPSNGMRFLEGAPAFAVEVRSEGDYGPAAEAELAAKRADYFEAGTEVVWDVDPVNEVIWKYSAPSPDSPVEYRRGDVADAEPVALGWRVDVSGVFG